MFRGKYFHPLAAGVAQGLYCGLSGQKGKEVYLSAIATPQLVDIPAHVPWET
jgi:hypothetical protein